MCFEAPGGGHVIGEVPRQEDHNNRAGRKSVSGPEPSWCRGRHRVRGGDKCCEADDAEPRNRPEDIIAIWDVKHVEKHANHYEERWSGECEMRELTRADLTSCLRNASKAEERYAVDKRLGKAHGKPRQKFSRCISRLHEVSSRLM